jgi:hypothetical protein
MSSNRTNANIEPGLTLLNEWGFRNRVPCSENGANIKVYLEILNATYWSFDCWDMLEVMKNLLLFSSSWICKHYSLSEVHWSSWLLVLISELYAHRAIWGMTEALLEFEQLMSMAIICWQVCCWISPNPNSLKSTCALRNIILVLVVPLNS